MRSASLYDRLGETLPLLAVHIPETAWERLRAVFGLIKAAPGTGLLIEPASSTHTWGRRTPIDVVFLGANWIVLAVIPHLAPWRLVLRLRAARVLHLAAGEAGRQSLRPGQRLYCFGESQDEGLVIPGWSDEPAQDAGARTP